ncbi:MAG: hypothetical protein WCJ30_26545, partial [Deltaproteobacteria bacterium]
MRRSLALFAGLASLSACGAPHPPADGGDGGDGGEACVAAPVDLPDPANRDENCDGIDGDARRAVFVAPDGSDTAPGTREAPLATLGAALLAADRTGATQVLVAAGSYTETRSIALLDGIGIYGGYERAARWTRGARATDVNVPAYGVEARGLRGHTEVMRVRFVAADASSPAGSSIALR